MERDPKWRQDTPRAQLVVMVMAAQGDLMNIAAGRISEERLRIVAQRALAHLKDAQTVLKEMPEGEW
jgi:hypothetical protein